MSGSVNKAIIVGNLGRDPEIRRTNSGDAVANLSVATSEIWRDKNTGEKKERTEWHRVTAWGRLAEIADRYLRKGSKVYIEGALQTRKWTDQNGQERYTTEIVLRGFNTTLSMLDAPQDSQSTGGGGYQDMGEREGPKEEDFRRDDLDDAIPFASASGIF